MLARASPCYRPASLLLYRFLQAPRRCNRPDIAAIGLLRDGDADILSSDYVPASLMESVFKLRDAGVGIALPQAVRAASLTPARAVGLCDRGEIAAGRRADLVRVRESEGTPVARAVWRAGERVV